MAETLYIRLGSKAEDAILWLIVNTVDDEIIASGELKNAEQLSQLTEKAASRNVNVFVPGCDFALKSLKVPGKSQRAIKLAAPYMIEDELGQDVDNLFFAYADLPNNSEGHNCYFAAVEKQQMALWLAWLEKAQINTQHIMPDVLALPLDNKTCSAIALETSQGHQVLFRQSSWHGFVVDDFAWEHIANKLNSELNSSSSTDENLEAQNQEKNSDDSDVHGIVINAFSPLAHSEHLPVKYLPEELPLALLAKHGDYKFFNLLQGKYKVKKNHSQLLKTWFLAAALATFALLLNVTEKGLELYQVNNEQSAIEEEIISTYKKAFPQTKLVRISTIKSQLNQKIAQLGGQGDSQGFLAMLAKVQPAFKDVSKLKPDTLKFDGKRQELRIQAEASTYQEFDQLKSSLEKLGLTVKSGSQNNQGNTVTGSFSITSNSSSGGKG